MLILSAQICLCYWPEAANGWPQLIILDQKPGAHRKPAYTANIRILEWFFCLQLKGGGWIAFGFSDIYSKMMHDGVIIGGFIRGLNGIRVNEELLDDILQLVI